MADVRREHGHDREAGSRHRLVHEYPVRCVQIRENSTVSVTFLDIEFDACPRSGREHALERFMRGNADHSLLRLRSVDEQQPDPFRCFLAVDCVPIDDAGNGAGCRLSRCRSLARVGRPASARGRRSVSGRLRLGLRCKPSQIRRLQRTPVVTSRPVVDLAP